MNKADGNEISIICFFFEYNGVRYHEIFWGNIMIKFDMIYAKDLPTIARDQEVVVIDLRSKEDYEKQHWPGAYSLPIDEMDDFQKILPKGRYYVLYCDHGGSSMMLARYLGNRGYLVGTVRGGFAALRNWVL